MRYLTSSWFSVKVFTSVDRESAMAVLGEPQEMGPHKETGSFSMSLVTINYISSSVISQFVIKFYALKNVINLDCMVSNNGLRHLSQHPLWFLPNSIHYGGLGRLIYFVQTILKISFNRPADLYYFYMNFFAMSLVHKLAITQYVSRITIQNLICANMFCNFMN